MLLADPPENLPHLLGVAIFNMSDILRVYYGAWPLLLGAVLLSTVSSLEWWQWKKYVFIHRIVSFRCMLSHSSTEPWMLPLRSAVRTNICKLKCSILIIYHVLLWYMNPCYISTMQNDCEHLTTTLQSNFEPPPTPLRAHGVTIVISENEQQSMLSLVQTKACRVFGAKLLSESMMTCYLVDLRKNISMTFYWKFRIFHSRQKWHQSSII